MQVGGPSHPQALTEDDALGMKTMAADPDIAANAVWDRFLGDPQPATVSGVTTEQSTDDVSSGGAALPPPPSDGVTGDVKPQASQGLPGNGEAAPWPTATSSATSTEPGADPSATWVDPYGGASFPYCSSSAVDPDGDGWGWEREASCKVR
jgi:hypothetical protein